MAAVGDLGGVGLGRPHGPPVGIDGQPLVATRVHIGTGEPEVSDLEAVVDVEQDVLGLDVPVGEPGFVQIFDPWVRTGRYLRSAAGSSGEPAAR